MAVVLGCKCLQISVEKITSSLIPNLFYCINFFSLLSTVVRQANDIFCGQADIFIFLLTDVLIGITILFIS